jgi:hypothetical protein
VTRPALRGEGVSLSLSAREVDTLNRRIDRSGGLDACWPWTGSRYREGYGRMSVGGVQLRVTRLIWRLLHGPIPDGWFVCHSCDLPECCNPSHLFVGPPRENSADMVRKGRSRLGCRRGDANPRRRLTDAEVRAIRDAYAADGYFGAVADLARRYGVSETLVRGIVKGRKRVAG